MRKPLLITMMCLYLFTLLYLTLVYNTAHRVSGRDALNLLPFRTIAHYLREGGWEMRVNLLGNLAAFLPLGILLPLLRRSWTGPAQAMITGAVLSAAIETVQYLSGRRVADIDDVLLNALGAFLGYALFVMISEAGALLQLRARSKAAGR